VGVANVSSPWTSGSKGWRPSYLGSIEPICAKLTLGESLRSYNPDQAVSLSTDLVQEAQDIMIADPNHAVGEAAADGIELDVDVIGVHDGKVNSRAGLVNEIAGGLQRVRSLSAAPIIRSVYRSILCCHPFSQESIRQDITLRLPYRTPNH
jgi:hypothetical protein